MFSLTALLLCHLATTLALPSGTLKAKRDVYVSSISQCPKLAKRTPTSVHDLRPDDFSYTMALGDSITAGCFSHGLQDNILASFGEYRGDSYANGANPGAITIPNLIKNYNANVTGGSLGSNPIPELCYGPLCPIGPFGWNPSVDQLNAAQSGAMASNLPHEARDYLVPLVKLRNIPAKAFKYLNLQIGSNDQCALCTQAALGFGPGSADDFEANIRKTLEIIRAGIPNTVVNILGVIKVSDVYTITLNEPYCEVIPGIPHYNIECPCMLLPGSVGDTTRALMDKLKDQYNERLIKIVKDYQTAHYSDFAVTWQPASFEIAGFPVSALSDVDCFHPSLKAHQFIAAGVWNRLVGDNAERSTSQPWVDTLSYRCLQEDDRIQTSALL
ncbi:hypothetical protein CPB86DRAFT_281396 [Serendipita vermifera]|nr:hypothetical protein CPB86DRAFT_281396 [Serendipita vermifera]